MKIITYDKNVDWLVPHLNEYEKLTPGDSVRCKTDTNSIGIVVSVSDKGAVTVMWASPPRWSFISLPDLMEYQLTQNLYEYVEDA